jgi:hypothetical protein
MIRTLKILEGSVDGYYSKRQQDIFAFHFSRMATKSKCKACPLFVYFQTVVAIRIVCSYQQLVGYGHIPWTKLSNDYRPSYPQGGATRKPGGQVGILFAK